MSEQDRIEFATQLIRTGILAWTERLENEGVVPFDAILITLREYDAFAKDLATHIVCDADREEFETEIVCDTVHA